MRFRFAILTFLILAGVSGAAPQTNTCQVSDQMKKEQKLTGVRAGSFMLDQPSLTPTQLANGPDFNAADPEKSRFAYFTAADNIFCYFRPSDPQTCDLRATLDGDKQVLKEAQDLMIQRLGRLDPQTVRAIFTEARFQTMDQKQLRRLRDSGSQNPEEAALDE